MVSDDARLALVGDLVAEAAAIADAERGARRLLSFQIGVREDGAQIALGGAPTLAELLGTLGGRVQPSNRWTAGRAAEVRASVMEAPILAMLGGDDDLPGGWLQADAALQRLLLHAGEPVRWAPLACACAARPCGAVGVVSCRGVLPPPAWR